MYTENLPIDLRPEGYDETVDYKKLYDKIIHNESAHFTCARVFYIIFNFALLLGCQIITKNPKMPIEYKWIAAGCFATINITLTLVMGCQTRNNHHVKKCMGYKYDEEDIIFESVGDVLKVSITCMIAAVLCGCTGIAGGMVLGPLFMSYGMNA